MPLNSQRIVPLVLTILVSALLFRAAAIVPSAGEEPLETALAAITPALVRSHVEFLSHDLLEGRDTGHRGYEIAREYVASQYRRMGLQPPAGGSYLQPFELLDGEADNGSELRVGSQLVTGKEASFVPDWQGARPTLTGPGVFAGLGLVTDGRDDYAGTDVRNHIVFLLPGVPPEWTEDPKRSILARTKIETALNRGAAAVVVLSLAGSAAPGRPMALADGTTSSPRAAVTVGAAASTRLLSAWGEPADTAAVRRPGARAVGTVTLTRRRELSRTRSWNVVGLVPGRDPELRDESVVFTAHLDHVGIGDPDARGDRIFNGTHDNALGVGKLLASAEAMARLEPRRTIVFAAVGAEERGMLGTQHYITHPVAPRAIAAINHDGGLEGPATDDLFAFGAEYSSLGATLEAAAQQMGMRVSLDVRPPFSPSQALLFRSDHHAFLRAGIPAIYLMDGYTIDGDGERGRQQWIHYLAHVNHRQGDNFDPAWAFESPVRMAALSVRLAWTIANAPARPTMHPNTLFPARAPGSR
jgi:hypothetical protein